VIDWLVEVSLGKVRPAFSNMPRQTDCGKKSRPDRDHKDAVAGEAEEVAGLQDFA